MTDTVVCCSKPGQPDKLSSSVYQQLLLILSLFVLATCATAPPKNSNNACAIFSEYDDWYEDTRAASERWNVPIPVLLAIIRQESAFEADAKPPRTRILWIFPGPRPSSAYGYSQALDGTWEKYLQATRKRSANRDKFADAVDFVGWYVDQSWRHNGIPKQDAYRQYLAYHEGQIGFADGTYRDKPWLVRTAQQVSRQANSYRVQLAQCGNQLKKRSQS